MSVEEAKALYLKLIEEEMEETLEASKNKDLIEYLDGIWDVYWVLTIYNYIVWEIDPDTYQSIIAFLWATNLKPRKFKEVLDEIVNEVAKSNFTKEISLQTDWEKIGKVVKGDKFKKPNIKRIVKKYHIEWKA